MSGDADRTAVGKIGRMPADVRREVSRRLADHESASAIIAWLDGLHEARTVLDEMFDGARVSPQNLSEWKKNPEYLRYCRRREDVAAARAHSEFALDIAKASGGISAGSIAVLGGKILQMLEGAEPDAAAAVVKEVIKLRAREQKDVDLSLKKRVIDQNERKLQLAEKQFQLRACELFMDRYEDKKVRDILDGKEAKSVKLDQLRTALFGEKPENLEY